ncbi:ethanolamine utilization protein EutD [Ignatzschineria ureiclastica]|nr:phosphate acetyltransferase [Ignatzschineria ureiclastica]GHA00085.1 ethanolamine utilization protein EutD [Ignatzschineria ureiclastica]
MKKEKMTLIERCQVSAKGAPGWVVFPDAVDERAIRAAIAIQEAGFGYPWLLGDFAEIKALCQKSNLSFDKLNIIDPQASPWCEEFAHRLEGKVRNKSFDELLTMVQDPLWFGASMLATGRCDFCIAGNLSSTADVLRAGLRVLGLTPGNKTLSSLMIMISPNGEEIYGFSDCGVIPVPTTEQLADIALTSAYNFAAITGEDPSVAMLSFSTKGSAKHEVVTKVMEATELVRARDSSLKVDGELQFDAAIVPSVGAKKAPNSDVAGRANVLIFPSLEAGNIGYKIAQRLGGYEAIGPLIQGLNGQMHDLSRGCSWQDMVQVLLISTKMKASTN